MYPLTETGVIFCCGAALAAPQLFFSQGLRFVSRRLGLVSSTFTIFDFHFIEIVLQKRIASLSKSDYNIHAY